MRIQNHWYFKRFTFSNDKRKFTEEKLHIFLSVRLQRNFILYFPYLSPSSNLTKIDKFAFIQIKSITQVFKIKFHQFTHTITAPEWIKNYFENLRQLKRLLVKRITKEEWKVKEVEICDIYKVVLILKKVLIWGRAKF